MTLPTEDIAAAALARWLADRKGRGLGAAPPELDDEVIEAVYALRPDLAPAPTVTIEEILATLDQAEPLAQWLDAVGDPPEALDDDVAEAIYALSPDRAPGPKVSIDDILGRLTAGPLAAPAAAPADEHLAEIVPFPARPAPLPEPANTAPSFQGRAFGQERRRGRWVPWVVGSGAFGALAAAALVAIVVLPTLEAPPMSGPAAELAEMAPLAGDAPRLESEAAAPEAVSAPEVIAAAPSEPAQPEPTRSPRAAVGAKIDGEQAVASGAPATSWWEGQPAGGLAREQVTESKEAPAPAGPAPAVAAASPPPAEAPPPYLAEESEEAVADLFDEGGDEDDRDFGRQRQEEASSGLFGGAGAEAAATDELGARGASAPIEIGVTTKKDKSPRRGASASNMAYPDSMPAAEAEPLQAAVAVPPGFSGLDAATQERLLATQAKAEAEAARGRPYDAARTISANIVAPASVGQWYAARAARWYVAAGRPDLALTACDLGLSYGAAPSAELSAACAAAVPADAPATLDDAAH